MHVVCQTSLSHPTTRAPLPRSEWEIPEEHFDTDRGGLLRFVAQRTAEVIREHWGGAAGGAPASKPVVGFCFSFPVDQTALDNGKVLVWTKVGGLVLALLSVAMRLLGAGRVRVAAKLGEHGAPQSGGVGGGWHARGWQGWPACQAGLIAHARP